ncbi:hypothetical protein B0H14DRAFT_2639860 [Mycena olivaceomarginata]|nr:hypothetical protein B0H14DRAFT_2639860 [Mycena olivaceomarginata]
MPSRERERRHIWPMRTCVSGEGGLVLVCEEEVREENREENVNVSNAKKGLHAEQGAHYATRQWLALPSPHTFADVSLVRDRQRARHCTPPYTRLSPTDGRGHKGERGVCAGKGTERKETGTYPSEITPRARDSNLEAYKPARPKRIVSLCARRPSKRIRTESEPTIHRHHAPNSPFRPAPPSLKANHRFHRQGHLHLVVPRDQNGWPRRAIADAREDGAQGAQVVSVHGTGAEVDVLRDGADDGVTRAAGWTTGWCLAEAGARARVNVSILERSIRVIRLSNFLFGLNLQPARKQLWIQTSFPNRNFARMIFTDPSADTAPNFTNAIMSFLSPGDTLTYYVLFPNLPTRVNLHEPENGLLG